MSSNHRFYYPKVYEICVGNISRYTEQNALIAYFGQFGSILQFNSASPTGGYVFITYKDRSMVDCCMNARPHHFDDRTLYVKRALPIDDEHPRERFDTTRLLMIVIDSNSKTHRDPQFSSELQEYFSTYGLLRSCKYCKQSSFDYILVEFEDADQVDRVILDKPHYYNNDELNVMKYLQSNIEIQNNKYSSNRRQQATDVQDAIDDENFEKNDFVATDRISENDLEKEVFRLQILLKKMDDDFALKRRELKDRYGERLKKLQENIEQTHCSQQDLEREHAKLSAEYETIRNEKETLSEQYLTEELENFEITSYYEQILEEEKAKTVELQMEYQQKLEASRTKHSSLPSISSTAPISPSSLSKSSSKQTTSNTD